jgi:hypothetical protein
MSYQPIAALALKSTEILLPAQTIASATTVTLGAISDSTVVTKSGNTLVLPAGRSYFITAGISYSQSTGSNAAFAFYSDTDAAFLDFQTRAYSFYNTTQANAETYDGTMMASVTPSSDMTISLRKSVHSGSTVIIENSANAYFSNSTIRIFYTD